MMSTDFALRLSAKSRLKDLFDAKTANVQNQLRRNMSKTVPLTLNKDERSAMNSRTSEQRGTKSAPTNDFPLDPMKHSPDSSVDNTADQDDLLQLDQGSYNELQADADDNLSVRS